MGPGPSFLLLAFRHAGSVLAPRFKMYGKKDVASSSAAGPNKKNSSRVVYTEKPVDKLNVGQFCERFYISKVCPFSLWTERPYPPRNL